MAVKHHNRYVYSPIIDRPVFDWPGGARLAVYLGMNLEVFSFGEGLGAQLAPAQNHPDVLNYAWRDYGNRVGAWRLMELFDRLGLPATVLANVHCYDETPGLIEAFRSRGDEIAAHGRTNAEAQGAMTASQERQLIRDTTRQIAHTEGVAPLGWLGPWISQSANTPDLLDEIGYEYLLDWCHDDQPVWMKTQKGHILSVPYPQELNDIPAILVRRQEAPAFAEMIMDAFDVMLEESRRRPLVMGIALHGYIMGQPHRSKHLERALRYMMSTGGNRVWWTTAGDINTHYRSLPLPRDARPVGTQKTKSRPR